MLSIDHSIFTPVIFVHNVFHWFEKNICCGSCVLQIFISSYTFEISMGWYRGSLRPSSSLRRKISSLLLPKIARTHARTLNHARVGSTRDPKVLLPQDGYGRINTSFDGPPHVISETNILHTLTGKKVKETLKK